MKIGDFGMSRQIIMRHVGDEVSLERAMSANVIGTAAYSAPELLLADSPVKKNQVDAATVLKSDVSCHLLSTWQLSAWQKPFCACSNVQLLRLCLNSTLCLWFSTSSFVNSVLMSGMKSKAAMPPGLSWLLHHSPNMC